MAKRQSRIAPRNNDPKEIVTVSLGTKDGDVRASAVGSSMTGIVALVQEIQHGIAATEELLVRARPFRKGSFQIPLEFIVVSGGRLFVTSPLLERLFELMTLFFETKIALKGRSPDFDKSGSLLIDGRESETSEVLSSLLRPSSRANIEIAKAMSEIEQDAQIKDFSIFRGPKNKRIIRVGRKQFHYFSAGLIQSQIVSIRKTTSGTRAKTTREELVVRVIALEGSARWKFNWKGRVISAKITDATFLERVRKSSERFGAGDRLEVELIAFQKFHEATRDYIDASYEISRVWSHKKVPTERRLFEHDES